MEVRDHMKQITSSQSCQIPLRRRSCYRRGTRREGVGALFEVQITYAAEGFNLRKWKIVSKIVQEAINGMNDRANPSTERASEKTITKEDESYAKTRNGPPIAAGKTSENAILENTHS